MGSVGILAFVRIPCILAAAPEGSVAVALRSSGWLQRTTMFHEPSFALRRGNLGLLPPIQETQVQSLVGENPLQKGMATHSSILAWRIPWTEEPGRLRSTGSQSRTRLKRRSTHTCVHRGNVVTPMHHLKFDFTDSSQITEGLNFFNGKTNPLCFQENVENLNMEVQT